MFKHIDSFSVVAFLPDLHILHVR